MSLFHVINHCQVLYKRKPVQYETRGDKPEETIFDSDTIWAIEETGEVYKEYEPFLKRMYFYRQKKFTCSITGQSGLDFFSAQQSEQEASHDVEDAFPDALRFPILRKVQHSTISRIDNLGKCQLVYFSHCDEYCAPSHRRQVLVTSCYFPQLQQILATDTGHY